MPAPLTGNAVTGTGDQAAAPGTRAPAPVAPGHEPRKARALLPRRTARRYPDPLFGRPDLIEDDYYRLRNQPCG